MLVLFYMRKCFACYLGDRFFIFSLMGSPNQDSAGFTIKIKFENGYFFISTYGETYSEFKTKNYVKTLDFLLAC